ncbi:hypothetical protein JYQ62_02545 [Nostoc sp. UHCC 0702]|nr:hypothetical protein JYQ62_02545 [Nostoc sp. UHCC 0702]
MTTISSDSPKTQVNRILPLIEKNYNNNVDSDYTEKIEDLDKNFKYSSNSNHYWREPEHSLFYGTPLYQQASLSQKLSLNHLSWIFLYRKVADSEMEITHYNTITADCLIAANSDYEILVKTLAQETAQERKHIHAFYQVSYQTTIALLGKKALINSASKNCSEPDWKRTQIDNYLSSSANFVNQMTFQKKEQYHAENLKQGKDINKHISLTTQGFFNGTLGHSSQSLRQFFPLNWGSYPFLAANFYAVRYMANLLLKSFEFNIHNYYKKLERNQEFIPIPTSISHYHFLDESFHTTTSLFLGRDFYKYLPKPSIYEKFIANLAILQAQRENLNGFSAVLPYYFLRDDGYMIGFMMKLLQSPLFDMSATEALHWIEKCLCHEHEGFHLNLKLHNHLLTELRKFAENLDYLWPINREMRVMASGGSIKKAIQNNITIFRKFSQAL